MKDEVKFSVIATGFPRAGAPGLEQKSPFDDLETFPAREMERNEEEEPALAAVASGGSAPVADDHKDDLEMPAFLRRDRRLYQ
jgi:hypothetical protein